MGMTFAEAMKLAAKRQKRSLRSIATETGVSYDIMKNLSQGKSEKPNFAAAQKIADALGVSVDGLLDGHVEDISTPSIAVAGRVGAGAKVPLEDAYEKGDGLYHVACPPQISPRGVVAVEVEGDSMSPAYEAGDVLFYSRDVEGVPSEAVGRKCVVCDDSGDVWVKQVRRREGQPEGLFDLVSINTGTDPRYDVRLKWASPVRMYLPVDLVKRLNV